MGLTPAETFTIMRTNLIRKRVIPMLQILIITLRESIEAFLIVAITIAYLRKTGQIGRAHV